MKLYLLLFLVCLQLNVYSQVFGTGLSLDDPAYADCPKAPQLISRDLENLPAKVSLRMYAPVPGNQGVFSTCTGWTTAYAARTIIAAIQNNWDQEEINNNAFSPSFIYNQIRPGSDCSGDASIIQGMQVLKNEGALTINEFPYNCNLEVKEQQKKEASEYKIKEYRTIAYRDIKNKVPIVKKSISEYNPVLIAINCPPSFYVAGEVWEPDTSEYNKTYVGHALAVIGYDDNLYGGAFEIMNSWGTDWGKGGFTWIKYKDFNHFCLWAGEEIPEPVVANTNKIQLSGAIAFRLSNESAMEVKYNGDYFQMIKPYDSGTQFHLVLSNNEPAYVYAIGSDLTYKCKIIFPFSEKINPYLPYQKNNIALPGEGYSFQLDSTKGKTYFCFFYSPFKLNIDSIATQIERSKGSFWERVHSTLNKKMISSNSVKLTIKNSNEINFFSKDSEDKMMVILVEISHE